LSRDGASSRTLYIRRKGKWLAVGFLTVNPTKATIYTDKITKEEIKEAFGEWLK